MGNCVCPLSSARALWMVAVQGMENAGIVQPHTRAAMKDAAAMAGESPAVQAAVDAAKRWSKTQEARSKSHVTLMSESDQAAPRALQKPFASPKRKIAFDSPVSPYVRHCASRLVAAGTTEDATLACDTVWLWGAAS